MTRLDLAALESNYSPYQPQQTQPQQTAQPKKKKRNFWLDQISTVTGIAGGIGGGILGAAAGGVGAVPGAAVGGGAGSALGEAIENLISPDTGDWGNVAEEAALGAVFSAGPIKLGKAGVQVARGVGKSVAKEGAEAVVKEGIVKRSGRGLLGDAWGIRSGVKTAGKVVTPQRAGQLQEFVIKEVGVPKTASADQVFSAITGFQDEAGKAISSAVKTTAKPINTSTLASNIESGFSKVIGKGPSNAIADDILLQVKGAKSPQDLWQVRRNIDDALINFSRNPSATVPGAEQLARTARTAINKELNSVVPGLSQLNKKYSTALEISDLVAGAARTPKGIKVPGFLGSVGGQTAQRTRAGLGTSINALTGSGAARGSQTITPKGVIGRNVTGALLRPGEVDQQTPQQSLEEALMAQGDMGVQQQTPQSANPYPRENLLFDIQRDPANAEQYMKQYAMFQELFAEPEVKPLTGEAQKRALTAESGLRSLDTLLSTLETDPGAFRRQALPNPFGLTARLTGTTDVRAATDNVVDVLARLRSGAAITDAEAARFARLLPQPGDSQESALKKIRNVAMELQSFATNPGGGGGLEDALMQYQQQGGY